MRPSRGPRELMLLTSFVSLLLTLYVWAYWLLIRPAYAVGVSREAVPVYRVVKSGIPVYLPSARWDRFFFPIHWLDRRLRPDVWEPKRKSVR